MLSRIPLSLSRSTAPVSCVTATTRIALSSCSCSRLAFTSSSSLSSSPPPSSSSSSSESSHSLTPHRTFSTTGSSPSSTPTPSTSTSSPSSTPSAPSSTSGQATPTPNASPTFHLPSPSTSRPISQKTMHGSYLLDPQNPPMLNANHYKMLQQVEINEADIPPQILPEFRRQIGQAEQTLASIAAAHKAKYGNTTDDLDALLGKSYLSHNRNEDYRIPKSETYDPQIENPHADIPENPIDPKTGLGPFGVPLGSKEARNSPTDREFILDYADLHYKQAGPLITVKRGTCIFCPPHRVQVHYTNVELLHRFINERGMITHRRTNYNCAKHQRKVASTIKRARHLGLLPYTSNWSVPVSFVWGEEAQALSDFQTAKMVEQVDANQSVKQHAESLYAEVPNGDSAATTTEGSGSPNKGDQADTHTQQQPQQ